MECYSDDERVALATLPQTPRRKCMVSDHRQWGKCLPRLSSAHGSRRFLGPERVEAASHVRLDQHVRRRWPLRSAASSVGESCEAG